MARSKKEEKDVMILQLLETEPEQLMKISGMVWGMTGATIGSLFIFLTLIGFVVNLLPGTPHYPTTGIIYLLFISIIMTFVLTIFYAMTGALLGSLLANAVNWILQQMGGIKLKVRKMN